jgi:hypothetical protein
MTIVEITGRHAACCAVRWCAILVGNHLKAAPHSTAHVSGAMARPSQAPVLILTAPYASTIRIAMVVATAAA